MADPIPAATLILFRERGGATEHLFVERAQTMTFAAGAIVFPGGRVDAGDRSMASDDDGAARVAAIRETIEETGIAVGLDPPPDAATLAMMRERLEAGLVFADILATAGLALDLDALTPFARWCPNFAETRSYDTRFYLARAPGDADARVDATENVRLFWSSARAVLDDAAAGRVHVIFPTLCNLERLAMLGTYEAARAQAQAIAPHLITPRLEERTDGAYLTIPADRGYPVTAHRADALRRG